MIQNHIFVYKNDSRTSETNSVLKLFISQKPASELFPNIVSNRLQFEDMRHNHSNGITDTVHFKVFRKKVNETLQNKSLSCLVENILQCQPYTRLKHERKILHKLSVLFSMNESYRVWPFILVFRWNETFHVCQMLCFANGVVNLM